jgi:hypothetical protein
VITLVLHTFFQMRHSMPEWNTSTFCERSMLQRSYSKSSSCPPKINLLKSSWYGCQYFNLRVVDAILTC